MLMNLTEGFGHLLFSKHTCHALFLSLSLGSVLLCHSKEEKEQVIVDRFFAFVNCTLIKESKDVQRFITEWKWSSSLFILLQRPGIPSRNAICKQCSVTNTKNINAVRIVKKCSPWKNRYTFCLLGVNPGRQFIICLSNLLWPFQ